MTSHSDFELIAQLSASLPPDDIERRLGRLIRHYLRSRSPAIASSVVWHIELLCSHPGFAVDSRERRNYLRLRAHWRWLAKTHVSE